MPPRQQCSGLPGIQATWPAQASQRPQETGTSERRLSFDTHRIAKAPVGLCMRCAASELGGSSRWSAVSPGRIVSPLIDQIMIHSPLQYERRKAPACVSTAGVGTLRRSLVGNELGMLSALVAPLFRSGVRLKTRKRNIVVPHDPQVRLSWRVDARSCGAAVVALWWLILTRYLLWFWKRSGAHGFQIHFSSRFTPFRARSHSRML